MRALLSVLANAGLAVLSPPRCAACDVRVPLQRAFCEACAGSIERARSGDAAFVYGGAMATAIARLKYAGRADLGGTLGALLAQAVPREGFDLVAPVPLHPARLVERGFNQSALLATPVARSLGVPLAPRLLVRVRPTPRQASLDRAARQQNVSGAFRARLAREARGKRVLLIDDVRTTGATLDASVAALRDAEVADVRTFTLAVAPHG